jgi:hypothetical protein
MVLWVSYDVLQSVDVVVYNRSVALVPPKEVDRAHVNYLDDSRIDLGRLLLLPQEVQLD